MKKYGEKIKIMFFPAVRFHGNGGHIRFYGTHQGTYNFKTAFSNAVKVARVEDIQTKKRTLVSVFSFVEYYIFNHFLCEKHAKMYCDS